METRVLGSLAIFTLASLPACGGGGGSSSGPSVSGRGFAPHTGPGDVENYFPNAVGNEWSSNYTASSPGMEDVTGQLAITIAEPRPMMGVSATVFSETDSRVLGAYENYYGVSPGGVTSLGNNSAADSVTPNLVPFACMLFPVGLGTISTLDAQRIQLGSDQFGNPLTLDAVQVVENVQYETLETWAGTFPGTIQQITSISGTVHDAAMHIDVPYNGSEVRWFAPGAGVVRQANSVTVDTLSTSSDTALRGYKVNGVRHGVGVMQTAFSGLVPGDFVSPPEGIPALASDGTNFLVVSRKVTGTWGQYLARWVVQRVSADGSLIGGSIDLDPPQPVYVPNNRRKAAVVFDGVEYIVVYEQDLQSPDSHYRVALMSARVSSAGVVLGEPRVVAAVSDAQRTATEPVLAFDGTRCLLCYVRMEPLDYFRTYGVFLSPSTGEADGPAFALGTMGPAQSSPALAFDGAHYLAVWNQQSWWDSTGGLVGARIGMDGTLLDPAWIVVHSAQTDPPAIGCDGGNFLVLWSDHRAQPGGLFSNVYGNRISPNGQLLDGDASTGGFAVTGSVGRMEVGLALAHFDDSYLVVWLSSSSPGVYEGIYGRRLSNAGDPIGPAEGTLLTQFGFQTGARLAAGSASALLTFVDESQSTGATHSVQTLSLHPRGP